MELNYFLRRAMLRWKDAVEKERRIRTVCRALLGASAALRGDCAQNVCANAGQYANALRAKDRISELWPDEYLILLLFIVGAIEHAFALERSQRKL